MGRSKKKTEYRRFSHSKRIKWYHRTASYDSSIQEEELDSLSTLSLSLDDHERPSRPSDEVSAEFQGLGQATVKGESFFRKEVLRKSRMYLIGEQEAEMEVTLDVLIDEHHGKDGALLHAISTNYTEITLRKMVTMLLHRGARPVLVDANQRTALHHASIRNLQGVCQRLLEHGALAYVRDKMGHSPYSIALRNQNDGIASLMLAFMPNEIARSLYISASDLPAEHSFHQLLLAGNMQKTVLSLLDCQADEEYPIYRIHYQLLESDDGGRPPNHPHFNRKSRSALHIIAQTNNKNVVYHDVVRLLIRRKWKDYAKRRFSLNAVLYIMTSVCMTYSAIVACGTVEPALYDSPLQYSRAVTEFICAAMAVNTFLLEIGQMFKNRFDYWRDPFNWVDVISSSLLIAVIPLRFLRLAQQWPVFAIAYFTWAFRIFKYAAVFRQTGAYAQILWRIVTQDFVQFLLVFAIFLLAFSGSFMLILRGEAALDKFYETSVLGTIMMALFLLVCIVILLNTLIAQLSDTYQNVQGDAQRALELNRAWIVTRVEVNSIFVGKGYREQNYRPFEELSDPQNALETWEDISHHEDLKGLREVRDRLDLTELNFRALKTQMAKQGHALANINAQLRHISQVLLASGKSPTPDDAGEEGSSRKRAMSL